MSNVSTGGGPAGAGPSAVKIYSVNEATVVLWRHAPTAHNETGRLQGRLDTPVGSTGLALGRESAQLLLHTYGVPREIFTSPLMRATATAQLLSNACLSQGTPVAVTVEQGINQRSYGIWEGKTLDEVGRQYPKELAVRDAGGDPLIDGWEPGKVVGQRVAHAVTTRCAAALAGTQQGQEPPVLVFTSHGSAIAMGMRSLLAIPESQQVFGYLAHANWVELRLSGGTWSVERFNFGPR